MCKPISHDLMDDKRCMPCSLSGRTWSTQTTGISDTVAWHARAHQRRQPARTGTRAAPPRWARSAAGALVHTWSFTGQYQPRLTAFIQIRPCRNRAALWCAPGMYVAQCFYDSVLPMKAVHASKVCFCMSRCSAQATRRAGDRLMSVVASCADARTRVHLAPPAHGEKGVGWVCPAGRVAVHVQQPPGDAWRKGDPHACMHACAL